MRYFLSTVALCLALIGANSSLVASGATDVVLKKAPIEHKNIPSLQRGAKYFMAYCAGCHSASYTRYNAVAKDLGLSKEDGSIDEELLALLMPTKAEPQFAIESNMAKDDSAKWFGISVPDLTLVNRVRGADWVYTYLLSFYADETRPWGVNNLVFKDVAMPHVLQELQGTQTLKRVAMASETGAAYPINTQLTLSEKGALSAQAYEGVVGDIVNFLDYVAEPAKSKRKAMGVYALCFLAILFVLAWLLKREIWKDIR